MDWTCLAHQILEISTKQGHVTLRAKTLTSDLWQSGTGHGDNVLLPLRQDDDIINGPLVVAFAGVERLPPAEPRGRSLGSKRKLVVDEAAKKKKTLKNAWNEFAAAYKYFQTKNRTSWLASPRLGEVSEVHLSDEAPADASVVAVLQQHAFLSAVCLVALGPVSTHPQVELHKLRPLGIQIPTHQLPQARLPMTHKCLQYIQFVQQLSAKERVSISHSHTWIMMEQNDDQLKLTGIIMHCFFLLSLRPRKKKQFLV